jgi:hypothetical protein
MWNAKQIKWLKNTAVRSLVGEEGGFKISGEGIVSFSEGTSPVTEDQITTEMERIQAEYDAQEYARNRKAEYPDWGSQLDYIYHNGIAKWKSDMVKPVKDAHPKP